MKKLIVTAVISCFVAFVMAGCATSKYSPNERPAIIITPESQRIEPPVAETMGRPSRVAEVIKSKVAVSVIDRSAKGSDATKEIVEKVEAKLIEEGFLVSGGAPFLTVELKTGLSMFDKTGNYFVYDGTTDAVIIRNDRKKLGSRQFHAKGKRLLEEVNARRSAGDMIAGEAADWVGKTCTAKTMGVETIIVTLRVSEWQSWLGGSEASARKKIKDFTKAVRKLDGILSCDLIERGESNRDFRLRIVYSADKFPDGMLTGVVATKKVPGPDYESNPVLWMLKSIFKLAESAF